MSEEIDEKGITFNLLLKCNALVGGLLIYAAYQYFQPSLEMQRALDDALSPLFLLSFQPSLEMQPYMLVVVWLLSHQLSTFS